MFQERLKESKINPIEKAGVLSRVIFFFTLDLFKKGNKKDIIEEDVYVVVEKLKSKNVGDEMETMYMKEKSSKKTPSVYKLFWGCIGKQYVYYTVIQFCINTCSVFLNPMLISNIIAYFTPSSGISKNQAILTAILFIIVNMFFVIYNHNYMFQIMEITLKLRTAISSITYRKCLKLSPLTLSNYTNGRILTLLNKDVSYIESGLTYFGCALTGIIHSFVITYVVFRRIGVYSFIGSGCIWIILIAQFYMGWNIFRKRTECAQKMDKRMQISQECLSAIKVIKMYTWETFFSKKISNARRQEISKLRQLFINGIVTFCIGDLNIKIGFFGLALIYSHLGNSITPDLIYFIIGSYVSIRTRISVIVPTSILQVSEMISAAKRIQEFLDTEELNSVLQKNESSTEKPNIKINNLNFYIKSQCIFNKISLNIDNGLNLLTGKTGSGKTTLLKIILKEYSVENQILNISGKISYVTEEPWLFPGTIKQNILFGEDYNDMRYNEVVSVCALEYDFDLFNYRDNTIVGNRGINISKGQQARINLARAVYRNSDIYLIDDCFSCLDVQVQEEIFENCIKKFLKKKLIVLVSCNRKYINKSDNVICIKNGIVTTRNGNGSTFKNYNQSDLKAPKNNISIQFDVKQQEIIKDYDENETTKFLQKAVHQNVNIYKEVKKEGGVDIAMHKSYIKFGGGLLFGLLVLVLFLIAQSALMYSDKLISQWANIEQKLLSLNTTNETVINNIRYERNNIIKVYTIIFVIAVILYIIRSIAVIIFTTNVSVNIHKLMIKNVMNATMDFFDSHLIGNILNRFSKDLATVDDTISFAVFYVLRFIFLAISITILITSTSTMLLIPISILIVTLVLARRIYIPVGRSLRRLDAATRSPIIGHLNDTLEGITVIRAYENLDVVRNEFDRHQDLFTSAHYMGQTLLQTFSLYLELLSIIFIAGILCIFLIMDFGVMAGNVGLAITQAFTFSGILFFGISQWAELETQMTAVERITEYCDAKSENKTGLMLKDWPQSATIQFQNVFLKYHKTNDTVLNNLNFFVRDKEKIGIVGRTGSGKSSIISSLFRLYEINGQIFINGVNIQTISLDFLRSNIAIIPQDPIIFTGTLRSNIDPNNQFTDEEIWRALEIVNIKHIIKDINQIVYDSEGKFSSGQRQLICLARALIQKNKIIILDEATANMDFDTDVFIQDTIKRVFSDYTMVTIAHRLNAVIKCDRVMVLDKGEIVEFDKPDNLLNNQRSKFREMVQQSNLNINNMDIKLQSK